MTAWLEESLETTDIDYKYMDKYVLSTDFNPKQMALYVDQSGCSF